MTTALIKIIKTQVPFEKLNWYTNFALFNKQALIYSNF